MDIIKIFFWRMVIAIPDGVIDFFAHLSIKDRLKKEEKKRRKNPNFEQQRFLQMSTGPIALQTKLANSQHYEVPTQFFQYVLGGQLKYSCCYYESDIFGPQRLSQAELKMLGITIKRAELENGQVVLELGCGWGALSLYMARKFPKSSFYCVSNSKTQKKFIDEKIAKLELTNIHIICEDINMFDVRQKNNARNILPQYFDRVVSVEMFEHMRNYAKLLQKISSWLKPRTGRLFIHIFVHRQYTYFFNDDEWRGASWMAKHFFSSGVMPQVDIFSHFDQHVVVEKKWLVDGKNYSHTAHDWYLNHKKYKKEIINLLKKTYGSTKEAYRHWFYWKLFFIACRELFGAYNGKEWLVGHYLLKGKNARVQ